MKIWLERKDTITQAFVIVSVYAILSFINLRSKLASTPAWFNGMLSENHELLLQSVYTNNEQSRILQYLIPEFLHRLFNIAIEHAYIFQRWFFIFLAFCFFHIYLKKWFHETTAFAGVTLLAALMPLVYFNHLQESAPLMLLTFLLGLWAIRERKHRLFLFILIIGILNNETSLILILAYFAYQLPQRLKDLTYLSLTKILGKTFLVSLPATIVLVSIRWLTRENPHLGTPWKLPYNVVGMLSNLTNLNIFELHRAVYLYPIFLFGLLWIYSFLHFKSKPLFLRRATFLIPFFIAGNMLTGNIYEARQMLPLGFIIIPLALWNLFPRDTHAPTHSHTLTKATKEVD
ncbi:MAG: hypothetical protein A3B74_03200 [Candidatus Kerfeldbacteria bacterium RIFCSPHIGHO2_02_FULL_42_14]|uniref:Glycosyltransferase RgtA/B/C/D-like domain-containing protein n=1 Tax=Candidatus Kerfeldbacteria bacterium RIFCSPHIGHO2_02_FULL_42_14 TaxID=1798540 RepID=A0A1G2ARW8_9BACT|nr:MAG: hypothetical protein A3B74_03200 [Candidatus Kerfeldbacteria bacterium RIFCSPHIGHO2_02_FULL_42_14]OGY80915.1 MAG: hypothetical protein A3E60_03115 [Candidatus Kerfeldbacteria bacterium RIFCSPHIGHO2_12_FULL_42_13]OGY84148.1 MAG: hypothetical protein A3I91_01515 [Candidatus Kerfeldbacteria bacterium RIFCSPLOWO2_02_FULL_42_19]OGY87278.1 MAG: hypothetical protein A3G01_02985 [Candidatus Kerfeldbacteria bacterium RIFCSPLOWO2_12_FULL_43_9]